MASNILTKPSPFISPGTNSESVPFVINRADPSCSVAAASGYVLLNVYCRPASPKWLSMPIVE
jgi:hypothetical protein